MKTSCVSNCEFDDDEPNIILIEAEQIKENVEDLDKGDEEEIEYINPLENVCDLSQIALMENNINITLQDFSKMFFTGYYMKKCVDKFGYE